MSTTSKKPSQIEEAILSSKLGQILQQLGPIFLKIGDFFNLLFPYLVILWTFGLRVWVALQPYHPEEFVPLIFGLIMVFFGGHYFTLFAAIEAYRMCGYEQTKECLLQLYQSYLIVLMENERDNMVDENNDGIADVLQIDKKELFTRKLSLILKSMDPVKVSNALSGLWMGFLSVVAVLRLKFAQAIALGATIGNIFHGYVETWMSPILHKVIPVAYHKWIPVIISYSCKTVGVSIAWMIQRVISAFYSSIRGAQMFTFGAVNYLARNGYQSIDEKSHLNMFIIGLIAWCGFAWQLQSGFSLSFPLNILLFPLSVLEWLITWMVAVEN